MGHKTALRRIFFLLWQTLVVGWLRLVSEFKVCMCCRRMRGREERRGLREGGGGVREEGSGLREEGRGLKEGGEGVREKGVEGGRRGCEGEEVEGVRRELRG